MTTVPTLLLSVYVVWIRTRLLSDLHDFVLVLAKQKLKLFVLTGQNIIAKQKKFCFGFAQKQNKTQNRAGQVIIRKYVILP